MGLSRVDDWDNFKDEKQQNSSNDPIPPSTSYQPKSISDIPGHPVEVGDRGCYFEVGGSLKLGIPITTGYKTTLTTWAVGHPGLRPWLTIYLAEDRGASPDYIHGSGGV